MEQVAIDYTYDPLYRLTRASYTGSMAASYAYSYDAVGNRLSVASSQQPVVSYTYDAANRLTSVNGQSYTWDNNGNLVSDGLLTYSYDQANRLKQVTQGANTYTFAYNGVGDRLQQTVGITTTRYVLDPAAGLTRVLSDGTNAYLYGNGRIAQQATNTQYFGADGLGSVRQLYDASGQVLANTRYDPYGSLMSQYGTATSVYGFTGEQYDSFIKLLYLRARWYDDSTGRFTQPDSVIPNVYNPQTLNRYAYVTNRPVNRTDPSGHGAPEDFWNWLQNIIRLATNPQKDPGRTCFSVLLCRQWSIPTSPSDVASEATKPYMQQYRFGPPIDPNTKKAIDAAGKAANAANQVQRMVRAKDIRFAQKGISWATGEYSEKWAAGEGLPLDDLSQDIASGHLREPVRVVEKDGELWALDNRRVAAAQLVDADIPVIIQDLNDPDVADEFYGKWDTQTKGRSVPVRGTDIVIGPWGEDDEGLQCTPE